MIPLLSIVIPTKNRQVYAKQVVTQILELNLSNVQIVVQDNSDTNLLKNLLSASIQQRKVKYHYKSGELSFVANFSLAIEGCDGEYICIIGDDDAVTHEIVPAVIWAKKHGVVAIKPTVNVVYRWPSSGVMMNQSQDNGVLTIQKTTGNVKLVNPIEGVEKLMKLGGQKYLDLSLVQIYHGIVKKSLLDKIKEVTGTYFGGLSPDIYSAVTLSLIVDKLLVIDYPLTISGICNASGSADSATGRHTGKLKDAPHFRGHLNYSWSTQVPSFYSVETIWADSSLAALKDLNSDLLLNSFNLNALSAFCLQSHPQYRKLILLFLRSKSSNYLIFIANLFNGIFTGPIKYFLMRVRRRLYRGKVQVDTFNDVKNIQIANELLTQYLKENNQSIDLVLNDINEINNKK